MKPASAITLATIVIGFMLVLLGQPFYILPEGTQAIITRFGEPVSDAITDAGIHWKTPFIDVVNRFERRLLRWDGDPNQIPTKDKRFIWIDATARWKISNPLMFLQSVGDEARAQALLDDIIDATTRDVITEQPLIEIVRSTNRELTRNLVDEEGTNDSELSRIEKVAQGRQNLTRAILLRSQEHMPRYGIELVDMRIKRINYINEVRERIYERMIAERRKAAEQFRSEGQGRKAEIEGRTERDLRTITSKAYEQSQEIKGKADAEATTIYAQAYSADPEFYQFVKTLETYDSTIDDKTALILSTDSDYYRLLKSAGAAKNNP